MPFHLARNINIQIKVSSIDPSGIMGIVGMPLHVGDYSRVMQLQ